MTPTEIIRGITVLMAAALVLLLAIAWMRRRK